MTNLPVGARERVATWRVLGVNGAVMAQSLLPTMAQPPGMMDSNRNPLMLSKFALNATVGALAWKRGLCKWRQPPCQWGGHDNCR